MKKKTTDGGKFTWCDFLKQYDELYPKASHRSWCERSFIRWFGYYPSKLDGALRKLDFRLHRTYGGWFERCSGIKGHSFLGFLLPLGLIFFLIHGPSGGMRGWPAALAFAGAGILLWFSMVFAGIGDERRGSKNVSGNWSPLFLVLALVAACWLVLVFLMYEPATGSLGRAMIPGGVLALFVVLTVIGWTLNAKERGAAYQFGSRILWCQLIVIVAVALVTWAFGDNGREFERGIGVYRHVLVPLVFALIAIPISTATIMARSIARRRVNLVEGNFRKLLERVEIFERPLPQRVNGNKVWRSFLNAILHPLQVVFLPALVVVVIPFGVAEWTGRYFFSVGTLFLIGVGLMAVLFSFASLHSRFDAMLVLYRRTFFAGGQVVVSVLVIILAVGRLSNIGYISTVLDGAPGTLGVFILAAYVTLWFSQYWLNRILGEELMALFTADSRSGGRAKYAFKGFRRSGVFPGGRAVQFHGGARITGVAQYKDRQGEIRDAYQIFENFDLLTHLVDNAEPEDLAATFTSDSEVAEIGEVAMEAVSIREKRGIIGKADAEMAIEENTDLVALETRLIKRQRLGRHARDLRKQFRYYACYLNLVLFGVLAAQIWGLMGAPQTPAAIAQSVAGEGSEGVDLGKLIFGGEGAENSKSGGGKRDKVVILAVSGGGTRAALYATSVLHGLAEIGRLDDVVLASGVSGGGAALAYFAEHREALIKAGTGAGEWDDFYAGVSAPFIVTCVRGSGEWQIAGGTRLGRLLDESFEREFSGKGGSPALNGIRDVGFLFNTGVTGENHRPKSSPSPLHLWDAANREHAQSWSAGTRLVLTNLSDVSAFGDPDAAGRTDLRFVLANGGIKLSTAAALNANFPPVFSNAPVDLDKLHRYWVTDGGSIDNRGAISALLAIRSVFDGAALPGEARPEIHVIVADASATSFDFEQKQGFGAIFGASSKLASGLIRELCDDVGRRYAAAGGADKFHFHYLPMPLVLRARGGLTTHWMMPEMVRFQSCDHPDPSEDKVGALTKNETIELIRSLHRPSYVGDSAGDTEGDLHLIRCWLETDAAYVKGFDFLSTGSPNHGTAWKKIEAALEEKTVGGGEGENE